MAITWLVPQKTFLIPVPYRDTIGKGVLLESKSETPNSPFELLPQDQTKLLSSTAIPYNPPISKCFILFLVWKKLNGSKYSPKAPVPHKYKHPFSDNAPEWCPQEI